MAAEQYRPAPLDDTAVRDIRSLEDDLGRVVVALQPPKTPAALSDDDLARLQEVEQRLGVVIVAYE